MNITKMGRVQQVVAQVEVVRLDEEGCAFPAPAFVRMPLIAWYRHLSRPFGVPHPDPDQAILFFHGKGANFRTRRDCLLTRNPDAGALTVEFDPVIPALQIAADNPSVRQRRAPVAASVEQGGSLSDSLHVKRHRLGQDVTPQRHVTSYLPT